MPKPEFATCQSQAVLQIMQILGINDRVLRAFTLKVEFGKLVELHLVELVDEVPESGTLERCFNLVEVPVV